MSLWRTTDTCPTAGAGNENVIARPQAETISASHCGDCFACGSQ